MHEEKSEKEKEIKPLTAKHGIICSLPDDVLLGYFAWPTVAKLQDGTIAAVCSGFRANHICACGKDVLFRSRDNGKTWDSGQIINDSMADDRDAGLIQLDNGELLLSWFSSDIRYYLENRIGLRENFPLESTLPVLEALDDDEIAKYIGSFIRFRRSDGHWSKPQRVLVSAPHGPIQLKNGDLFYFGCRYGQELPDGTIKYQMEDNKNGLTAIRSSDRGRTWKTLGSLNTIPGQMFEPHAIELNDGRILGMIRINKPFSICQTISSDGGMTWSDPVFVATGSPPHLMRHSSGTLVCTYARRDKGYLGQYAMFSDDEGKTWNCDYAIRNDADRSDLGYPSTVELPDGRMLSVYYQHLKGRKHASLLYSVWKMPKRNK